MNHCQSNKKRMRFLGLMLALTAMLLCACGAAGESPEPAPGAAAETPGGSELRRAVIGKCNKKDEALEQIRRALMIFDDYNEALSLLEEITNGK